jgi:hypothetical protein
LYKPNQYSYEYRLKNVILSLNFYWGCRMGAPVWEHHPQMKDVVTAPPYGSAGALAGDYLGHVGGDALTWEKRSNGAPIYPIDIADARI